MKQLNFYENTIFNNIITIRLLLSCNNYRPFSNFKEKKQAIQTIKDTFKLSDDNFKLINKDSILYEISQSLDKEVKYKTTNRRIDSFIEGAYTKEQLLIVLKLDQLKLGGEFDFEHDTVRAKNYPNFNSIEEAEKFLKRIDTSLRIKSRVKIDSIRNQ